MTIKVEAHKKFSGIFWITLDDGIERLATINLTPGKSVYDERLVEYGGAEYRIWNPRRSKLAAGIVKNIKNLPILHDSNQRLLYLGSASGTTASHISDIMGKNSIF